MPPKREKRSAADASFITRLFEIASKVKTAHGVAAIVLVAVYLLFAQIIAKDLFTRLGEDATLAIYKYLIDSIFGIAVAVLVVWGLKLILEFCLSFRGVEDRMVERPSSGPEERTLGTPSPEVGGDLEIRMKAVKVGIRSFLRGTEDWHLEMHSILDLAPYFEGRKIKRQEFWCAEIYPAVCSFLEKPCKRSEECHVHLVAHTSIAYAAGYCLRTTTGLTAFPVQYIPTPMLWKPSAPLQGDSYPGWSVTSEPVSQTFNTKDPIDVAIAIMATRDKRNDVRDYVRTSLKTVGRVVYFTIETGPSNTSIRDGTHAKVLAEAISNYLDTQRSAQERYGTLHIFPVAPNGLIFFLGQLAHGFGRCVVYEWPFEANIPGSYEPSMSFPPE